MCRPWIFQTISSIKTKKSFKNVLNNIVCYELSIEWPKFQTKMASASTGKEIEYFPETQAIRVWGY